MIKRKKLPRSVCERLLKQKTGPIKTFTQSEMVNLWEEYEITVMNIWADIKEVFEELKNRNNWQKISWL